jgi:hypothetical protein
MFSGVMVWCFCYRCPDVAKVKPKMIYASSKEELKKRLVGLACEIQGSDQGDVEFNEVCAMSTCRSMVLACFMLFVPGGVVLPWNVIFALSPVVCVRAASDVLV